MEVNAFIGMLVGGLASILGLFVLIYEKFLKPQSERHLEQIKVQAETNSELKSLNEKLDDILKEHEKQERRLDDLTYKYNDHEVRIRTIEKTNYKKYRVE